MLSGLIEVGDRVFSRYYLPGTPGAVREVGETECVVVFFSDETRKVEIGYSTIEKIEKSSGVIITPNLSGTCFYCGGQAVATVKRGKEKISCCNDQRCQAYVQAKIVFWHQKRLRQERRLLR